MARLARVVIPDVPHHITQRGNRRQQVFFHDTDYERYRDLIAEGCAKAQVAVLAWCLMPNHVHLVAVPCDAGGLRRAFADAHRRYTAVVNKREGWSGHLWQERFHSCPLDGEHLLTAVRYVELNPVRAKLADAPEGWAWSSAAAHLGRRADALVAKDRPAPLDSVGSWAKFLGLGLSDESAAIIRAHERTGRPIGGRDFVAALEAASGRVLARRKPGRPARE
jgi:putative transposase